MEQERPALPATSLCTDSASLTAIATSNNINEIFSRQIHALGQAGDILLCIASADGHGNLEKAIQAAHERDMGVVVLINSGSAGLDDLLDRRSTGNF